MALSIIFHFVTLTHWAKVQNCHLHCLVLFYSTVRIGSNKCLGSRVLPRSACFNKRITLLQCFLGLLLLSIFWMYPLKLGLEVFLLCCQLSKVSGKYVFTYNQISPIRWGQGISQCTFAKSSFLIWHFHGISCPRTPEQNGNFDRIHRHIVEMGRTLMAYSSTPPEYWVEAFNSTAVYLINRLPTKILNHVSTYEKLFKRAPNYSI